MPSSRPLPSRSLGRNDNCHCGSGKKYKKCCLAKDEDEARRATAAKAAPPIAASEVPGRLDTAVAEPPAPGAGFIESEDTFHDDVPDRDSLPPEIERRCDALWDRFLKLETATAEDASAIVEGLLELPHHATSWSDLFHGLASKGAPDLPTVFRRIAGSVAHTRDTAMSYFYWAAAEEFAVRKLPELLPEVAAGFRKLDLESYDADALSHVVDWLLADGYEAEVLALSEHFLPVMRADNRLMPYAAPGTSFLIFDLRVGQHLRTGGCPDAIVERLADELLRSLEDDVSPDAARVAAEVITGQVPPQAWNRADFALFGNVDTDPRARQDALRLYRTLVQVAHEAYGLDGRPPGCTLYGLNQVLRSVLRSQADRRRKPTGGSQNLLDCLQPRGMEARLADATYDLLGANVPQARLLLDSQETLLRVAERHRLVPAAEAVNAREHMTRLRRQLGSGASS